MMKIESADNVFWLRINNITIPFTDYKIYANLENVMLFNRGVMCGSLWDERFSEFSKLIIEVERVAA